MTNAYPRVRLEQTEERRLFSTQVGREYQLAVLLPENYAASQARYPIVYLLDGDLAFGMAAGMTPFLHRFHDVPELIVVGINYGVHSFEELAQLRELDFKIPQVEGAPPDSRADRFLAALKQEIIPFIESNYRADPSERILFGYSSSGFFVLYAICHEPGLFRRCLSGSGDLDIACPYLLAHDQQLASRDGAHPLDLYLAVGGLEDNLLSSYHELVTAINARKYPGVRLITEIYENEKHGVGGIALTYLNGLQKCFPKS
jgi:predicted alpha/beta superfamily hydrolase